MDRRQFLTTTASAGIGLMLAFYVPLRSGARRASTATGGLAPNAFLNITSDNRVTIWVTRSEMGQGVRTALPMMLAEELEADWDTITLQQASPGPKFRGIRLRTGGSASIYGTWVPYRMAGAAARDMLIAAGAARWNVPVTLCRAEHGKVIHTPTGRELRFGELCEEAALLPVPERPVLKDPKSFRLIGKPMKRIDGPDIVTGRAVYGQDLRIAGMMYAAVRRAPVLGAKAVRWNESEVLALEDVVRVVPVSAGIKGGVAVVARNAWGALKASERLEVQWDLGKNGAFDSSEYVSQLGSAISGAAFTTREEGHPDQALQSAKSTLEAVYEYPFQVHAPMEPMSCVADVRSERCEIWCCTQSPVSVQHEVANVLGREPQTVDVHGALLGGGFGRRLIADYAGEAAEISQQVGAPVQVLWSRIDDTRDGVFHPYTMCRLRAGLDNSKRVTGLIHTSASSDLWTLGPSPRDAKVYREDWNPWGAFDSPYAFGSYRAEYVPIDCGVPTGAWRAVWYPQNVFARESFIDEIAHYRDQDPIEFRRAMLDAPDLELPGLTIHRRALRRMLELAIEKSGWRTPLSSRSGLRRGRGFACNIYHGESLMAQVVEVSVDAGGKIHVDRIVCLVDCGQVINPLGVQAQVEGGIAWGLSAALKGEITFRNGVAEQSSYADADVLRLDEMPDVDIHILSSEAHPVGMGEPPVVPVAPAVANAVFAATGQRIRKLPLRQVPW